VAVRATVTAVSLERWKSWRRRSDGAASREISGERPSPAYTSRTKSSGSAKRPLDDGGLDVPAGAAVDGEIIHGRLGQQGRRLGHKIHVLFDLGLEISMVVEVRNDEGLPKFFLIIRKGFGGKIPFGFGFKNQTTVGFDR
jgi:hypothetical protein